MGVIYLTPGVNFPYQEIEESREEILNKIGESKTDIYYLSWRRLVERVQSYNKEKNSSLSPLLSNVIVLLNDCWGFFYEEIKEWPKYDTVFIKKFSIEFIPVESNEGKNVPIFENIFEWNCNSPYHSWNFK